MNKKHEKLMEDLRTAKPALPISEEEWAKNEAAQRVLPQVLASPPPERKPPRRWFYRPVHLAWMGGLVVIVALGLGLGLSLLDKSEESSVSIPVAAATGVRIIAEAGSLEVTGKSGLTDISVIGTAYAGSKENLKDFKIVGHSTDTEIVIEVETSRDTKLDLAIEVPDSFQVTIDDTSGSILVTNVAGVELRDGLGSIEASGVSGGVRVDENGSGDIDVRDVGQNVEIVNDGSGSITVSDVSGSFRVGHDDSGDITARDIDGDFVVEDHGSGGITYSNIGGRVDIPSD